MSSFVAGQNIEARCSWCGDTTGYVFVACLVVKVECRACGNVYGAVNGRCVGLRLEGVHMNMRVGRGRTESVGNATHANALNQKTEEELCAVLHINRGGKSGAKTRRGQKVLARRLCQNVAHRVPYLVSDSFSVDSLIVYTSCSAWTLYSNFFNQIKGGHFFPKW